MERVPYWCAGESQSPVLVKVHGEAVFRLVGEAITGNTAAPVVAAGSTAALAVIYTFLRIDDQG